MAVVTRCDRCRDVDVQVVPVLGFDLCNRCLAEARSFLATPPAARLSMSPREQVMHVCERHGFVAAGELASANAEPRRRAYYRLMAMVKDGILAHRGKGVFVPVQREAAE